MSFVVEVVKQSNKTLLGDVVVADGDGAIGHVGWRLVCCLDSRADSLMDGGKADLDGVIDDVHWDMWVELDGAIASDHDYICDLIADSDHCGAV